VLWRTCWGTHREPDGNSLGTREILLKKKSSPHPFECVLGPSDWQCENFLFPKRVCHHFWPGLIGMPCKELLSQGSQKIKELVPTLDLRISKILKPVWTLNWGSNGRSLMGGGGRG